MEQRKKKLCAILKKAKIYDAKLEPQIALTCRMEALLERLEASLVDAELVTMEINASGTEKQVVNPLLAVIQKTEAQLQAAYEALGLNYNINPQKIHEAKATDKKAEDFSAFFNNMNK